jgi:hypothetical protein
MRSMPIWATGVALLAFAAGSACNTGEPRTDAARLAKGREIIERMSARLGGAQAFTVTTVETHGEINSKGELAPVTLTRETTVSRRPDRLYSKVSGDRHNEVWYDGIGVTFVLHQAKVFGQTHAPETLDKTLDALEERFGIAAPFADYVHSSPAKALIADTTSGGWIGRETLDGAPTDHLAFRDKGVNWEIWIPASGEPLPRKAIAEFSDNKRLRKLETAFKEWDLAPKVAADRFSPKVPSDYEGIPMVQRARVLRHMPKDDDAAKSVQPVSR